jgi:hypothetical protein
MYYPVNQAVKVALELSLPFQPIYILKGLCNHLCLVNKIVKGTLEQSLPLFSRAVKGALQSTTIITFSL